MEFFQFRRKKCSRDQIGNFKIFGIKKIAEYDNLYTEKYKKKLKIKKKHSINSYVIAKTDKSFLKINFVIVLNYRQ